MFVCLLPKALRPPAWFLVMPGLLYFFFFFFYVDVNRYIFYSHKLFKMKKNSVDVCVREGKGRLEPPTESVGLF